jgi:hypothetical protein
MGDRRAIDGLKIEKPGKRLAFFISSVEAVGLYFRPIE